MRVIERFQMRTIVSDGRIFSVLPINSYNVCCFFSSDDAANKYLFTCNGNKLPQIMYNLGVSLLHSGKPIQAFDCLTLAVQVYHTNPRLWLRLAECCIMVHKSVSSSRRIVLHEISYLF